MSTHEVPSSAEEGVQANSLLASIAGGIRIPERSESERRGWLVAWLVALILHAVLLLGVVWLRVPVAASPAIPEQQVVHVMLSPDATQPQSPSQPRAFTELPKDRADSPPKKADLLSNVTSRARDREPGGDSDLPRNQGEADAALIPLEKQDAPAQPPSAPAAQRSEPVTPREQALERANARGRESQADARAESTAMAQRILAPPRMLSEGAIRVNPGSLGGADFQQPGMDSDGNAGLTGDVSLNTTAWEYAPWMERFGRQLMDHWVAPLVYSMGVLKEGGWCTLEVEISRSGEILRLDVLDRQGHYSLTQAAVSAVRSVGPTEKLPADFPEKTLILRLRMIYPRIRPR